MSRNFQVKDKNYQKSKCVTRRQTTMATSTPKTGALIKFVNTSLFDKVSPIFSSLNESKEKSEQSDIIGNSKKNTRKRKRKGSKTQLHFFTLSSKLSEESEWETYEQESVNSSAKFSQVSTEHDDSPFVNIYDPCTPEKTREGPAFESLYESPICGRYFEKSNVQRDDLLPINIPMAERDRPQETDVDEPVFHRDSNVKTYLSAKETAKRRQSYESAKKFWCNFWRDLMSDDELALLFNRMKNDPTLVKYYDVLSFLRYSYTRSYRDLHLAIVKPEDKSKVESAEDNPIPPGMMRVRGLLDKNGRSRRTYKYGCRINKRKGINQENPKEQSGKSKQKKKAQNSDVYNQYDETDAEFETSGSHGQRMTLSQFRQKQRMNIFSASPAT